MPRQDGTEVKVCKTFFLHTLDISDKMVQTVHENSELAGIASDKRGKHPFRPNQVSEDNIQKVRDHIN